MDNKVEIPYLANKTLYAIIFGLDGATVWNGTAFVAPDLAARPTYAIPLSDPTGLGLYSFNFPTAITVAGSYPTVVFVREAINPPNISDPRIGGGAVYWNGFQISQPVVTDFTSYSTPADADNYFQTRLYSSVWLANSNTLQKQQAMNDATRIIDQFRFIGTKTDPAQLHEWPRDGIFNLDSAIIPPQILQAQFEMAFELIKGYDAEREIRGTRVTSRRYGGVATTYDTKNTPEYMLWGIPSALIWNLIRRYIDFSVNSTIQLDRIN